MSDLPAMLQAFFQDSLLATRELSQKLPGSVTTQALVVGALVGLIAYKASKKRYKLPPGPFAWPLLGNLLEFIAKDEAFYVKLQRWAKEKYGPVLTVYIGPKPCIILNDDVVATEAFVKKGEDFAGRPFIHSVDIMSEGSKDIAFAPYSPTWKLHRKIAMQALRHYMSGKHLEKVVHQKVDMICQQMFGETEPFDPFSYSAALMFHVLETICFGENRAYDDPVINRNMELFNKATEEGGSGFLEDAIPLLRHWPTKKFTRVIGMMFEFYEYLEQQIDKHRKSLDPDNIRDLTDSILWAQKEATREERPEVMEMITDTHVRQTIGDMFGAGVDTSRFTLYWALLLMAGNPEIQKKAQEEIDAVTGSRMPETGDRAKTPYTQAVVYETLRFGVIVPIGVPRKTECETSVGGFVLPKNTTVMVNQWALLHDPKTFEDPEEFRPERFLDEQGNLKKVDWWTPFSAGRRACLGETVAKPELVLLLSCLLKRCTISLPEGAAYDPSCDVGAGMGLHIPKRYKIVVKAR